MNTLIKKILNSSSDVRIAYVNGRAVAVIRKNPMSKGYCVDNLYSQQEKTFTSYSEARDAALSAPQYA